MSFQWRFETNCSTPQRKKKEIQGYFEDLLQRFAEPDFYEDEDFKDVREIVNLVVGDYMETFPNPVSPYVKILSFV